MSYGFHRFERCLSPYTNSAPITKVPASCSQSGGRGDLAPAVSGSAFRSFLFSQGIHKSDGGIFGAPETEGDFNSTLFGRSATVCRLKGSSRGQPTDSSNTFKRFGMASQSSEVKLNSISKGKVSGVRNRLDRTENFSTPGENREDAVDPDNTSIQRRDLCKTSHVCSGSVDSSNSFGTVGQVAFPSSAIGYPDELVIPGTSGEEIQLGGKSKKVSLVVEEPRKRFKRASLGLSGNQKADYRCQRLGMGSSPGRKNGSGSLDQTRSKKIFKLERVKGCSLKPPLPPGISSESTCPNIVRQYDDSIIFNKARGHKKQNPNGSSASDPKMGREQCGLSISSPSKGDGKHLSRSPQQERNKGSRVVSQSGIIRKDFQELGSSPSGPLCKTGKCKNTSLLLSSETGSSSRSRCVSSQMGLPSVLRFSPVPTDTKGVSQIQIGVHGANINSSLLAKKTLVFNLDEPLSETCLEITNQDRPVESGPNSPSRSSLPQTNSLVSEEQILRRKGLSEKLISTLLASRKKVTRDIYFKVWKIYNSWCSSKNFDFRTTFSVLEFLQEGLEKGLAASTLKTQVAALSVFLERTLSGEPLIIRFFRAMAKVKPRPVVSFPKWDLSLVLQGLTMAPFEPIEEASLRFLTLKTILLVAVTSARRISELQALSIKEPFMRCLQDRVVLRTDPAFLPKVASVFHRTQEIILPTFCPLPSGAGEEAFHTLDVRRCLLKYLERTKEIRKSSSLFVLMEGTHKGGKASKSTLGRWLKQAIKEAYISLGLEPPEGVLPHSTRAVAASWAERAGASPEQICKAATWSSFSTFIRHYRLDLLSASDQSFGRKVLQAVVPP